MKKIAVLAAAVAFSGCAGMMNSQPTADGAIADAQVAVKKAASVDGEWRDSGKFVKEAEAAAAAGDQEKAIKLATKAKKQGEMGYKQAVSQKEAKPWLF